MRISLFASICKNCHVFSLRQKMGVGKGRLFKITCKKYSYEIRLLVAFAVNGGLASELKRNNLFRIIDKEAKKR